MRWIDREEGAKLGTLAVTVELSVDRTLEMTLEVVASQTWVLRVVVLPLTAVGGPARRYRYSTAYLTFTPTSVHHPARARASIFVYH